MVSNTSLLKRTRQSPNISYHILHKDRMLQVFITAVVEQQQQQQLDRPTSLLLLLLLLPVLQIYIFVSRSYCYTKTTTTYHQLICGGDPSCEVIGGDATVLADYALTTTTTLRSANKNGNMIGYNWHHKIRPILLPVRRCRGLKAVPSCS